jgi:hypothetical protein
MRMLFVLVQYLIKDGLLSLTLSKGERAFAFKIFVVNVGAYRNEEIS